MIILLALPLVIAASIIIIFCTSSPKVTPSQDEAIIAFNRKKPNDFIVVSAGETAQIPFGYTIATMELTRKSISGTYRTLTYSLYWNCEYAPDNSSIFSLNKAATTFLNYAAEDIEQMIESAVMQSFTNANNTLISIKANDFYNQKDLDEILSSSLRYILSEIGYTGILHAFIKPKA